MEADGGLETWKDYGPWYPTARLRWRNGKLEQIWRRNFEKAYRGGIVMGGNDFEDEWREVPADKEETGQ